MTMDRGPTGMIPHDALHRAMCGHHYPDRSLPPSPLPHETMNIAHAQYRGLQVSVQAWNMLRVVSARFQRPRPIEAALTVVLGSVCRNWLIFIALRNDPQAHLLCVARVRLQIQVRVLITHSVEEVQCVGS
jgi:hypothetical protein